MSACTASNYVVAEDDHFEPGDEGEPPPCPACGSDGMEDDASPCPYCDGEGYQWWL